jgi:hypothetical protein
MASKWSRAWRTAENQAPPALHLGTHHTAAVYPTPVCAQGSSANSRLTILPHDLRIHHRDWHQASKRAEPWTDREWIWIQMINCSSETSIDPGEYSASCYSLQS